MYYCQREINSLAMAMTRIGFASLKSIVIAVSTKDIYKNFGEAEKLLWEHSVGVSIAAQTLAQDLGGFKAEEIFVAGLLHDIGKTLLNNKDSKKYSQVFHKVHQEGKSFVEAEQELYGFTHAEVGALLISKWNLPVMLTDVIRLHHHLESSQQLPQPVLGATALLNLADLICLQLGIGYKQPMNGYNVSESLAAQILSLHGDHLEHLVQQTTDAFQGSKDVFL